MVSGYCISKTHTRNYWLSIVVNAPPPSVTAIQNWHDHQETRPDRQPDHPSAGHLPSFPKDSFYTHKGVFRIRGEALPLLWVDLYYISSPGAPAAAKFEFPRVWVLLRKSSHMYATTQPVPLCRGRGTHPGGEGWMNCVWSRTLTSAGM